VINQNITLLGE